MHVAAVRTIVNIRFVRLMAITTERCGLAGGCMLKLDIDQHEQHNAKVTTSVENNVKFQS